MKENLQKKELQEVIATTQKEVLSYYPILKAKRGELKALRILDNGTKRFVTPIIELVGGSEENVKSYLTADWAFEGNKVLLDPFILLNEDESSFDIFKNILDFLNSKGVNAVPVIRLDYSDTLLSEFASILNNDSEIAIRVTKRYAIPRRFDSAIEKLKSFFAFDESNVSLIIDYSYIEEQTVDTAISSADALLRHISLGDYLAIILAAGSFVKDLSLIPPDSVESLIRYEWDMWNEITSDDTMAEFLSYSDYATRYPIYDDSVQSFPGSSSIRYTSKSHFVILRGHVPGNHPDGMGQYHDKCNLLIGLSVYDGAAFSAADSLINDCAAKVINSGNPETWVKISTARHIEKIVSLLN
ncbi:beta family protein [Mucilaginibacter pocheonensis]|uniref:Beta protein n=1 Tax=Mucilaginibacter pocheonensis TaxID=398050 RepID=A0ABU1TBV0_9SPHI|nr:hypothetical protein [Mucilaginibacter pocheonensis]MDR6942731.1 hypothetical protein [Mucilaginibacter pocheonensis]